MLLGEFRTRYGNFPSVCPWFIRKLWWTIYLFAGVRECSGIFFQVSVSLTQLAVIGRGLPKFSVEGSLFHAWGFQTPHIERVRVWCQWKHEKIEIKSQPATSWNFFFAIVDWSMYRNIFEHPESETSGEKEDFHENRRCRVKIFEKFACFE